MSTVQGIRKRWMLNSLGAVCLIVLLVMVTFTVSLANYYYVNMETGLKDKVRTAVGFFATLSTESEYTSMAAYYTDAFTENDKLELQFLDGGGRIFSSSYAYEQTSGSTPDTQDIQDAINNKVLRSWMGKDPQTGERIMAVSQPILHNGEVVGVMRMVTSLRLVDQQIIRAAGIVLLIGLAIIAMVYFSNLYFVKSIVEPMEEITSTARQIANGSYGIQIEKKYDDEIGELADTINDMSLKISQSEKVKSEFISSVSHELRTPLTAINGWGETLLREEAEDSEDQKKGMSIIVSEARRLSKMVEELLDFTRIEDGRFTLYIQPTDIKAELEDAVYTYREFFRKEGIALEYHDCEEEFDPIPGDPERLRQVFSNLLDNASKHGGGGKRISVSIVGEEGYVVIRIRDFGNGIPEDELPHVKAKFYKGSSKARGSGIGLAVCEEIVTRHNGHLEIANADGGGCIVTIHLPKSKKE